MPSDGADGIPVSRRVFLISTAAACGHPPNHATGSGCPTSWHPGSTSSAVPAAWAAGVALPGARWASTLPRKLAPSGAPLLPLGRTTMETLERIVAEHPFFAGLEEQYIQLLAGCASNVRFEGGKYILREGEEASQFFLIRHGRVALEISAPHRGRLTVETLGEGDILGWSWLIPPYHWRLDARAVDLTGGPQLVEVVAVAQGVHRLPEAVVAVARELAFGGERAHRGLLPHGLRPLEVAGDLGREHEEAAVGPAAVAARLLLEPACAIAVDVERAEAARWLHCGDGCTGAPVAPPTAAR